MINIYKEIAKKREREKCVRLTILNIPGCKNENKRHI